MAVNKKPPKLTWIGGQLLMTSEEEDGDVDRTERPVDLSPDKLAEMREAQRLYEEYLRNGPHPPPKPSNGDINPKS